MVKVKICGITCERDLEAATQAGADILGFIVDTPASPRNISLNMAETLIDMVPSRILSVAVTVFKNIERILEINRSLKPNIIQIHGGIDEKLLKEISSAGKVVPAVNARSSDAIGEALKYSNLTQAILVDTCSDSGLGGTGRIHDWSLSRKIRDRIYPAKMFLAGGLTPENVRSAIEAVEPYGVDVSSGVEAKPGVKDPTKMIEFVRRVREAEKNEKR
ncbi:phosphoribosylanthranilate isomerase [Candidatus Bathyarchaeota archaeon]|nr:phosphoribosylanthranilate isomerase [Candidatus Bathyarchaeota archaeon]MBS7629231.1 phosphoribosylanthranilate isomerase [Candidatus Bathyarchaeota archaeon]